MVNILNITRYAIKNTQLIPWVKFIWQIDVAKADLHYKLLPTDSIDVILNLADNMVYETEGDKIVAPSFHINGLRSRYSFIHQADTIRIFGISFYPYGLYPFVHTSLKKLHDKLANLYEVAPILGQGFEKAVANESNDKILSEIEQVLINELTINQGFMEKARLISDFMAIEDGTSVKSFCSERAINIKTLERMFLYYTGYTPKVLRCIKRFQNASNQLMYQQSASLTDITYWNSFTDQSHFIKEFTRFSGTTPCTFQSEKITVKENAKYTYI